LLGEFPRRHMQVPCRSHERIIVRHFSHQSPRHEIAPQTDEFGMFPFVI
jgi:hypothetical protein